MVTVSDVLDAVIPMASPNTPVFIKKGKLKGKPTAQDLFFDKHEKELEKIFSEVVPPPEPTYAGEGRETLEKISKEIPGIVGIYYWAWKDSAKGKIPGPEHIGERVELAGEPGVKAYLRVIKAPGEPMYPLGGYLVELVTSAWLRPCFFDEVRLVVKKAPKPPKVVVPKPAATRKRRTKAEMLASKQQTQTTPNNQNGKTPDKAVSETAAPPKRTRSRRKQK